MSAPCHSDVQVTHASDADSPDAAAQSMRYLAHECSPEQARESLVGSLSGTASDVLDAAHRDDRIAAVQRLRQPLDVLLQRNALVRYTPEGKRYWRWRDVVARILHICRGASADEYSLLLQTHHWLEVTDLKHRWGSNLKPYYKMWLQSETDQSFFVWLDEGDGRSKDLADKPRSKLEAETVVYCGAERCFFQVAVRDGRFIYVVSGQPVTTRTSSLTSAGEASVHDASALAGRHADGSGAPSNSEAPSAPPPSTPAASAAACCDERRGGAAAPLPARDTSPSTTSLPSPAPSAPADPFHAARGPYTESGNLCHMAPQPFLGTGPATEPSDAGHVLLSRVPLSRSGPADARGQSVPARLSFDAGARQAARCSADMAAWAHINDEGVPESGARGAASSSAPELPGPEVGPGACTHSKLLTGAVTMPPSLGFLEIVEDAIRTSCRGQGVGDTERSLRQTMSRHIESAADEVGHASQGAAAGRPSTQAALMHAIAAGDHAEGDLEDAIEARMMRHGHFMRVSTRAQITPMLQSEARASETGTSAACQRQASAGPKEVPRSQDSANLQPRKDDVPPSVRFS